MLVSLDRLVEPLREAVQDPRPLEAACMPVQFGARFPELGLARIPRLN